MDDKDAIIATARDYWEGWFDGDAERMKRALHPGLTKTGVVIDASGGRVTEPMTAGDMIGWTGDGEGVASRPADFAYDVTVDDVYHQIATVTVHSAIYREYLHLVKTPDGWKILNALYTRVLAD
jgi:Putative lumazine-binding